MISRRRWVARLLHATTACLLLPPPAPAAGPARVRVVGVKRGKRSKVQGGDFDDRKQALQFTVTLKNEDMAALDGGRMRLIIIGDAYHRDYPNGQLFTIVETWETPFALKPLESLDVPSPEWTCGFDRTGIKWGASYAACAVILRDANGSVLTTYSDRSGWIKDFAALEQLPVKQALKKDFTPAPVLLSFTP